MAAKRGSARARRRARPEGVRKGDLLRGLAARRKLRNEQRAALSGFPPIVEAYDEILTQIRTLASTAELHPEIVHLLNVAAETTISGFDHIMAVPAPHDVEESRMLMEIDFLLRDFAATPIGIDDWATAEDFQRQRRFGFGQLRTREERRRGMPDDVVLPERDQWATHSVHSHPLPSKDVEPAPSHPSFSLLASLTDLLDHARNVTLSGRTVVLSVAGVLPPGYDEFPNTAGFEFRSKVSWLLESHIPSEDMIALYDPRPKKQTPAKYWQDEPRSAESGDT